MKLSKRLLIPLVVGLILSSLRTPISVQADEKPKVLTTFYPVYYLTKRIAGEAAEVDMLLSGNQDAHDYEGSAQDIKKVQEADLMVYQDDEMEYFMEDLMKAIDDDGKFIKSTKGIELLAGHDHHHDEEDHDHGHEAHAHDHGHSHDIDPHTWLDPEVYAQQGENVMKALVEADPANKKIYQENYDQLAKELAELDREYADQFKDLEDRLLVVEHEAFGYLAHAYDLQQEGIIGLSSTREPSATTIAQMQKFVKDHDVKTIFVDPQSNTAIAQTVADANGSEVKTLHTLEVVDGKTLEDSQGYFKLMRENLKAIASE